MTSPTPMASPSPVAAATVPAVRRRRLPVGLRAVAMYVVGALGLGVVMGVLWRAIVKLPMYRLDDGNHALISERGLTTIFAIDAWYAGLGFVAGIILGVAAWKTFRPWGWRYVVIAWFGSLVASMMCWAVGTMLGPGPLQERLASAHVGDYVPVDFQLHAHSTLAAWPFGTMAPLLILGTFVPDPEARPRRSAADPGDDGA